MKVLLFPLFPFFLFACESSKTENPSAEEVVLDSDGDGFSTDEDCDDTNPLVYPGTEEVCDGIDNDCNQEVDEGVMSTFYADFDGDGFGSADISIEACSIGDGFASVGTDCDDSDNNSYPGAEEVCDGVDNDCNGEVDEGMGMTFYADVDGDGFGDDNSTIEACELDLGLSTIAGDCDDADSSISPIASEICDEMDNNCNDEIDEGVGMLYYRDFDEDGFGDDSNTIESCTQPEGYIMRGEDCDDAESFAHPSAIEICDGIDNDCDGDIDEDSASDTTLWYADFDSDGFGNASNTYYACNQPSFYVSDSTDCDDSDDDNNPTASETCDGEDNNCDGNVDEDGAMNATIWYFDADLDSYGDLDVTVLSCSQPSGYVASFSDCDDTLGSVNPDATESCNGADSNCDGVVDNAPNDGDCDGVETSLDCDDTDDAILEQSNDLDCDGVLTEDDCDDTDDSILDESIGLSENCGASSCQNILDEGYSTGSGSYWLEIDALGDTLEVYCDMSTEGLAWLDVVETFHLSGADVPTLVERFFVATDPSNYIFTITPEFGLTTGNPGVLFNMSGPGTHSEGFHLIASNIEYTQVRLSYRMQGSNDSNRCASSSWIPLCGPGYNGGYSGYLPSCISGYTCITGTSTLSQDAPIQVDYSNDSFDSATELLTWSHSDYNEYSTSCARDSEIPSSLPTTFIKRLLIR